MEHAYADLARYFRDGVCEFSSCGDEVCGGKGADEIVVDAARQPSADCAVVVDLKAKAVDLSDSCYGLDYCF